MAGILTYRLEASGLPKNISDHQCLLHGKGDSQLRDSQGFAPYSHINRSSNHDSECKGNKKNKSRKENDKKMKSLTMFS